MVIGSNMLQSHLLSTTTMKRLLLGICWITKDLPITAQTARKKKNKDREGTRKRERETVENEIWQTVKEHGYDVNFHVCHRICVMSVHILPWQRGRRSEDTGCMSRVLSISPPAVNKHTKTQTDSHQHTHTYIVCTHISQTHSIRLSSSFSSFPFLKALLYPIQGKHQWSVAEYKTLQRQTNGNHTLVLIASHGCVLLAWEIRPCLGLLARDLWPWISFIKKRGRKDDLFFLSPFLSWSPASLPCSLSLQLGDLSNSLWGIYQTHMKTRTCDRVNTHRCKKYCIPKIRFLNSQQRQRGRDLIDQNSPNMYRNISIFTHSIPWPI